MKIRKVGKEHYLMIKLNARDRKYVQGFNKLSNWGQISTFYIFAEHHL
jgi:hypothetical protein